MAAPPQLKNPTRRDTRLDFPTYSGLIEIVKGLLKLSFDNRDFQVMDYGPRNGKRISLRRQASSAFSGVVYVAGNKVAGLASDPAKPWVKVRLDAATATEETGPPPIPFPDNEEWYEKAYTYGDIHESRA